MSLKVMTLVYCTALLGLLALITFSQAEVFEAVQSTRHGLVPVNGSDQYGGCPDGCRTRPSGSGIDICRCPPELEFTNLLVDGFIPDIGSPSNSQSWASQLFTVERTVQNRAIIGFDFQVQVVPTTVVITMFNCPPWDIFADTITVYSSGTFPSFVLTELFATPVGSISLGCTSCDSLLTFHVPVDISPPVQSVYYVEFAVTGPDTLSREWVHLAEISFTNDPPPTPDPNTPAPNCTIVPTPTITSIPTPTSSSSMMTTESSSTSQTQKSSTITVSETQQLASSSVLSPITSSTLVESSTSLQTQPSTTSEGPTMPTMVTMPTTTPPPTALPITIIVAVLVVIIAVLILLLVCGIVAMTCFLRALKRSKRSRLEVFNLQKSILESQQKGATGIILPPVQTEDNAFYNEGSYKPSQGAFDVLGYTDIDPITSNGVVEATYSEATAAVQDENYATISEATNAMNKVQQDSSIPAYTGIVMPQPPPVPEKSEAFLTELSNSVPNGQYSTVGHEATATPTITVEDDDGPKLLKRPLCHSMIENPEYQPSGVALSIFNSTEHLDSLDGVYSQPGELASSPRSKQSGLNVNPIYSDSSISPQMFIARDSDDSGEDSGTDVLYAPIYTLAVIPPEEHNLLEVSWDNIRKVQVLGKGFFGEVILAETIGLSLKDLNLSESSQETSVKVAVKKLQGGASSDTKEAFEKEYKFMSRLEHINVIRIFGICTSGDAPFIMMEYMEKGDLNQYLQKYATVVTASSTENAERNNNITVGVLVYIATQIASAMKYLASHNYVHRDLATRNCLVGEEYLVKIADFGMSRSLYESHYYRVRGKAVLPVRWMARECFYGKFSTKTDVWAFGVLVWEVFMLGKVKPYRDMTDDDLVKDAVKANRKILEKPDSCPLEVYEIMLQCWRAQSNDRASFHQLLDLFSSLDSSNVFGDEAV